MPTEEEFVTLLIDLQPRLYGFVLSLLGSRNDADEVLQQTNLVLVRKKKDFTLGTNFGAWARKVAFHEIQTFRKKRARNRVCLSDSLVEQLAKIADPMTEEEDSRRLALRRCLNTLDTRQRRLITTRYSGVKVNELATQNKRSVGAVSQELYRIRTALADCIRYRLAKEQA